MTGRLPERCASPGEPLRIRNTLPQAHHPPRCPMQELQQVNARFGPAGLSQAENVSPALFDRTLETVARFGTPKLARIDGDWCKPQLAGWKDKLTQLAIRPIQQFSYVQGKNASDIALII